MVAVEGKKRAWDYCIYHYLCVIGRCFYRWEDSAGESESEKDQEVIKDSRSIPSQHGNESS